MNTEKLICIFSLSKADPHFRFTVGVRGAIDWLNSKHDKPHAYYFRNKPKNGLPAGSIMLFSFGGQIFGQATVREDIKPLTDKERVFLSNMPDSADYKFYLTIDPSTIQIFRFHPTKEHIEEAIDDFRFSQLFTYIKSEQYQRILEMTANGF